MATYRQQLQHVWHQYIKEHGVEPSTLRDALEWGVGKGLVEVPEVDPLAKLVDDMATALREEYAVDGAGRRYRVNHAVRVTRGGVQYTFWAMMPDAPRAFMQKAFIQRREQIVDDCVQLSTDVEAYNGMNSDQPPIQMLFDFRDDVEERRTWDHDKAA